MTRINLHQSLGLPRERPRFRQRPVAGQRFADAVQEERVRSVRDAVVRRRRNPPDWHFDRGASITGKAYKETRMKFSNVISESLRLSKLEH